MKTDKTVTSGKWQVASGQWPVAGDECHLLPVTRHPPPATRHAFTLIEVLVVVVLMSFIILALMAVFNSTQTAFRASLTQTDVLEGGRSAMGMIKSDLEGMTPSLGQSNQPSPGGWSTVPVNFWVNTNYWQYQSNAAPLVQSLTGSNSNRVNVLESFFILTRQNLTWTGVGYVVDTLSTNYFNPLYRFSMSTNVQSGDPKALFTNFLANLPAYTGLQISPTNPGMSHLLDGVVDLRVRAYDPGGIWMTNLPTYYYDPVFVQMTNDFSKNILFLLPTLGEVGFYMFSNTLPASVEVNLGVLEDRAIQRALSLPDGAAVTWARSNYLAQQAGKVHVFRQRVWIRNVDPSAYQ
jgi:prepilin-type N-terminal cleavage/methylation domain-containing protein